LKKHREGAHVALTLFGKHWQYSDINIMQILVGAFQGRSACKLRLYWLAALIKDRLGISEAM